MSKQSHKPEIVSWSLINYHIIPCCVEMQMIIHMYTKYDCHMHHAHKRHNIDNWQSIRHMHFVSAIKDKDMYIGKCAHLSNCSTHGENVYHSPTFVLPMFQRSLVSNRLRILQIHQLLVPRRLLTCSNNLPNYSKQQQELQKNDWLYFYVSRPRTGNNNKKQRYLY